MRSLPLRLLAFLTLVNILNFFDRYIVQAVEPTLKLEFGLSNQESGLLGSAFVFGYVVFSPLFGFLGDRIDRRTLMAWGLVAWSVCTALSGWAANFGLFFASRVLVGVGEASFGAIVPSYLKGRLPDMVTLNSALSIFYVAIPVGSALGYIAGGHVASVWGWRSLFIGAAVPGIVLAFGFLLLAPEKVRIVSSEAPSFFRGVRTILEHPVLRLTILGYVFNTFALNGVAMFVVRHLNGLGMSAAVASQDFGINLAITGFIGAFFGGQLSSWLVVKSANQIKGLLLFTGVTTLLGVPFLAGAFQASSPRIFLAACFVAQIALFAGTAPLNSVLVSRAPNGLEALTQGVTIFAIQLFGGALGPIVVGSAVDLLHLGVDLDPQVALAYALQLATVAMIASGVLYLWAAKREPESDAKPA
jgi:MFS family permease